jgi:hypothetical protein
MTTPLANPRHPRESGEESRVRILSAIRRRRVEHQSAPAIADLVRETGLSETDVRHHVRWLADQDPPLVRIKPARPMVVDLPEEVRP